MLGVVWGTASVVFLLGWGRGFVEIMHSESRAIGDGFIFVWPKKALSSISGRRGARWLKFKLEHVDLLADQCPSVQYLTPADGLWDIFLKRGYNMKTGNVFGVNLDAEHIFKLNVERGRLLQRDDLETSRRVIVLGADLKEALFPPGVDAIGSKIKVRGMSFEVVGVLRKKGETMIDWGGPEDEKAYIPVTTFLQNFRGSKRIYNIMIQPKEPSQSSACIEEMRAVLAKELDFSLDDKEAIEFMDIVKMLVSMDMMALIAATSVTIIGVITLFVGGVGVMNIMLISATERTREIGIRKALGAKKRHILVQFMAETLAVTLLSGIIGILVGCTICLVFAAVPRPTILGTPEISGFTLTVTFLAMVVIGLFAGVLPAYRAAGLDPVECLRYE
jgi:putative ABC transport system permease protein